MVSPMSLNPPTSNSNPASENAVVQPKASARFSAKLLAVARSLQVSHDAGELRQQFAEFRQAISSTTAAQVSAAIRQFLDSGKDVHTGNDFQLGAGGALVRSPSLRVLLQTCWPSWTLRRQSPLPGEFSKLLPRRMIGRLRCGAWHGSTPLPARRNSSSKRPKRCSAMSCG